MQDQKPTANMQKKKQRHYEQRHTFSLEMANIKRPAHAEESHWQRCH